jgi:hypothetical protein
VIAVVLQGGLGNQMFQYAAGRSLAAARGVELLLSLGALSPRRRAQTPRAYELDGFGVVARRCDAGEEREIAGAVRLGRLSRLLTRWHVHSETGPGFDPHVAAVADGTVLRGYWQSERYFESDRAAIARELTPLEPLRPRHEAWRARMAGTPSVSVHVRRGDYVALASAASFHGAVPLAYYQRAIDRIRRTEPAPVCYVFTDDPAWCQANLVLDGCETHHVSAELRSSGIEDLTLMRSCSHHIIANSSFSWWGAWLAGAGAHTGVVVAPRQWFVGTSDAASTADRFPSHWELL